MLVAAAAVIGGLLAWLWASAQGDQFTATAVVAITPADSLEDSSEVVDVLQSLDRGTAVVTAAGMAGSGTVLLSAQSASGLSGEEASDYDVEALQVLTSHLVDITVVGPEEATAIAYADAIADELTVSYAEYFPVYKIERVTDASIPDDAGRPSTTLIVIAAMIASALGAFMLWLALFGGSDQASRERARTGLRS